MAIELSPARRSNREMGTKLQQYDFEVIHCPGRTNSNADALSRRPCYSSECGYCERLEEKEVPNDENSMKIVRNATTEEKSSLKIWTGKELISLQNTDSDIGPIFVGRKIKKKRPQWGDVAACSATTKAYWAQWDSLEVVDGILYRRWEDAEGQHAKNLLLAPKSIWNEILQHLHNSSTAGHLGIKTRLARVHERFYWLNSRKFVENYCKRCDECSPRKGPQKKWKAPLKLFQVGSQMEWVTVDVLGPLPKTNDGNQYIIIAQDYFTKWPEAFPVPDQKATSVADVLVNQFFTRFGIPQELHSDQGRNFESEVFQDVCKLLGIHKTRTTPYHPQSDSMVERFNRTLENGLSMFVNQNHTDWDKHVPFLLIAYRSLTHETTKVTPGQMMFGRELKLPVDLWQERTSNGRCYKIVLARCIILLVKTLA